MSWFEDHYEIDDDGNINPDEIVTAVEEGDLVKLGNGNLWDKGSGKEYWPDGKKK